MYHVSVVGLETPGIFKSLSLLGPMAALRAEAKGMPGFAGASLFRRGRCQFAALSWDNPDALMGFERSAALARIKQAGATAEVHAFVCDAPPSREEVATLWHTARHGIGG